MDAEIMAVRVALLILVTGLFAAIWSGDHADQLAQVRQPSKQKIRRDYDGEPKARETISLTGSQYSAPLPGGIVAGTYLVADRFGGTRIRVVTNGDVEPVTKLSGHDVTNHYSVESGQGRWHYIRIESSAADQAAAPESRQSR
jgi:hypothetical protein